MSKFRKPTGDIRKVYPKALIRTVKKEPRTFDVKLSKKAPSIRVKLSVKDKLSTKLKAIARAFSKTKR